MDLDAYLGVAKFKNILHKGVYLWQGVLCFWCRVLVCCLFAK